MRIVGTDMPVRSAPARARARSHGFALPHGEAAEVSECIATPSSASIGPTMADRDQTGMDGPDADRQARRHGQAMLDALTGLQLAQLGRDPHSARAALARLASNTPSASDAGLQAVLQAIAARVAVELARSR